MDFGFDKVTDRRESGSVKWDVRENNGYTFQSDQWFAVDGNVQDGSSWSYLGEY